MTIKQLIKELQKLDKKHPRTEVVVDVQSMNTNMTIYEWSHRSIEDMRAEMIFRSDGDGYLKENSEHTVLALKIN